MLMNKKVVTSLFRYTSSFIFLKNIKYYVLEMHFSWCNTDWISEENNNLADRLPCFGEKTAYTRYCVPLLSQIVGIA